MKTVQNYLANVLDGMAKGLFASLIIGVIIKQIGGLLGIQAISNFGQYAQFMMGPCIGFGIAYVRKAKQFTMIACAVVGVIGAGAVVFLPDSGSYAIKIGEPVGAMIATMVAVEIGILLEGKTKLDLLIVPAAVIVAGGLVGHFFSPVIANLLNAIGAFINDIALMYPLISGLLLGITVGVILTLPISSAALCIAIGLNGLAAGAAVAGCCAQMIGFAVSSFRENKFSGLFAQGIGTSMIQMPNIIRNPLIWIPPTIASGVCGALAATMFKMETNSVGAGMGTSGLVGQFTTLDVMGSSAIVPIILLHFLIPAVISLFISEVMRKSNLIKFGDMQLIRK